ncbi:hypothetical protein GCM10023219_23840 [Stakelama sediminis]|uniref:WalW protein n=1 Tax=Stakelama sediminis TaxID=463200 RepID=A0A840YZH1_9SPHN|nr:polysaccharide deacetylase family protein [Stakelama sediminis]MBB5718939.1 hypothetical protein [Stakelama sediminis]
MQWSEDFGRRYCIFVDTEEEFDWTQPLSSANRDTTAMAELPGAHRRLRDLGASMVYLADYPVVTDKAAIAVLRRILDIGGADVGAQLHPWVTPPHEEVVNGPNSFPGNLPQTLEAAKIERLTTAICSAVEATPKIYRAGRYGIGPHTAAILSRHGYRVDSSMRARYDYSAEQGPDFGEIGNHAFFLREEDAPIVELPLTTVYTGSLRAGGARFHRMLARIPKGRGIAARLQLLSRVALTPEDMPLTDALEAVRVAAGEGLPILNFGFHSPSIKPGCTPYVRDERDLLAFYRWWDAVIAQLDRSGIRPLSQQQLVAAIDAARV